MMAFTTLIIAIPISLMLYFLIIKKVKKPMFSYSAVISISMLFFLTESLHLIYIGLEVIIIGVITIFLKEKYSSRNNVTQ